METGSTPNMQDYFGDLDAPTLESMELKLAELVQQGALSPEQAETVLLERSAMNGTSLNPDHKKYQMEALMGLQEIAEGAGMTSADRANLTRIKNDENTSSRGARDAVLQNAQARGMGGASIELMSQMQNQQDSATRSSRRDMDVAGQAKARALEAIMQQGALSGEMQSQDFNRQSRVANANDAVSFANAQNQQKQANLNTGVRNNAAASNLSAKQNTADQNTGIKNMQQQNNKNLVQQRFDNELNKRRGQSGILQANQQAQGQNSMNQANANNQMTGTALSTAAIFFGNKKKKPQEETGLSTGEGYQTPGVMYAKSGGLVPGLDEGEDTVPAMLRPGELVVRKEDVPEMLAKAHTSKDGKFNASAFLDVITGYKHGFSKTKT